MFWKTNWKKEAKLTIKGSNKFINYKRDLITEDDIKNIRSRQQDVKDSIKAKDAKETKKKCNLLEQACKGSLTSYVRPNAIAENTEVFFVAIVIALGLRAYALQPFRIPTGSMQPSLNGMHGRVLDMDEWPNFAKRQSEFVTHGRSYYNLVADKDKEIVQIYQTPKLHFFTQTHIVFNDGSRDIVWTSQSAILSTFINDTGNNLSYSKEGYLVDPVDPEDPDGPREHRPIPVKKGQAYASGFVDTGDLVLVDKMSYHFRKPKRGETFVFDTRNIEKIQAEATEKNPAGSHYIKRLVGLPGDKVSLDNDGNIYIDGKIATDEGLVYAMGLTGNGRERISPNFSGYTIRGEQYLELRKKKSDNSKSAIKKFGDQLILNKSLKIPQLSEYAAFGDNTTNSADSRHWGTVKQYNLVGPAFLSIWPFVHEDKQHWGVIK